MTQILKNMTRRRPKNAKKGHLTWPKVKCDSESVSLMEKPSESTKFLLIKARINTAKALKLPVPEWSKTRLGLKPELNFNSNKSK